MADNKAKSTKPVNKTPPKSPSDPAKDRAAKTSHRKRNAWEETWSKLCKDCHVIDGKNVTITDVDIVFSKIKGKSSRTITFEQFKEALQELSKKRFKDKSDEEAVQEIYKLIEGKAPIISGVTKAISSPTVSRLTDTSKFTGSHKERFDPSGKGKGKAGREDLVDASGYVSGYKHAGTYDHKVQGSNSYASICKEISKGITGNWDLMDNNFS
ncbi:unnamed protein product [Bubo scandiacus]